MKNNNYNINLNMNVTNIISDVSCYKITVNKKNIYAKKILYCIPKENLLKFKILNPIKGILEKSITTKPLCRVYAIFKEEDIWFKDLKYKILTDNDLRYIIPIDANKGIIMISYTDDKYTKKWNSLIESILKEKIVKDVKRVFNININKPEKVLTYNWDSGVAYWNKGVDSDSISNFLLNPMPNIYICGENYSMRQSWVEGALETSNGCIKKLCNS
jgi:monoamine oxidase